MTAKKTYVVILAGGQSTRLFPFSKVLADLTGTGRSLIQQAFQRAKKLVPVERIYLLTSPEIRPALRKQLKRPPKHYLADPARRGTWPALLWAMAHLRREDPGAVLAVLTGDHVIQEESAFLQAARKAILIAQERPAIVILGIKPDRPPEDWRGFGCFRTDSSGQVIDFEEKPVLEVAEQMSQDGGWSWNSGMFFFSIKTAEDALARFQPEMHAVYSVVTDCLASGRTKEAAFRYGRFPMQIPHPLDPTKLVDNSIDYAIMTPLVHFRDARLEAYAVVGAKFAWTDLGQWDALRRVVHADRRENVRIGKVMLRGKVRHSILVADRGHEMVVEDVTGLIAAFSNRMALVLSAASLPRVKEAVGEALRHPDRVIIEHEVFDGETSASGGRLVVIGLSGLSIRLKGQRLAISRLSQETI